MSPKEKSRFEDQAKQDKARFDQEMKGYTPSKGAGRGKKARKDPNAPKRPPYVYTLSDLSLRTSITQSLNTVRVLSDPSLSVFLCVCLFSLSFFLSFSPPSLQVWVLPLLC